MHYGGQPDYVRAEFLCEIFEPWTHNLPNDEWGEYLVAMHHLAAAAAVTGDYARAITVMRWFEAELGRMFQGDLVEDYGISPHQLASTRSSFFETIKYWRERAKAFKGSDVLEETIHELPEWMEPTEADQKAKDDPVVYTTKTGRTLTEADIEALADEAEKGYDVR